jgi:hypothetical protein
MKGEEGLEQLGYNQRALEDSFTLVFSQSDAVSFN